MALASTATASTLVGIAALHAAWGAGSSFPFADRSTMADTVAGTPAPPGSRECFAVAGLLATAAGLVADALPVGAAPRRVGVVGVAAVLGGRGALGVTGRTGSIVPWTPSARFASLDRRYCGPACIALAAGALVAARSPRRTEP